MKYGCIGEHLKHSFSKEIHAKIADYEYELREIPKCELDEFMTRRDFTAINVTIPYKERVLPHLYYIDGHAREIGAVNTIVNKGGRLYGYNTDFFGMSELIRRSGIEVRGKKAAILGTGGTSKTAFAVLTALGAREILKVSREACCDAVSYAELYEKHSDTEIIVNTTPVGMYPGIDKSPVDISRFESLSGVVDAVYNPLRTRLVSEAKVRGIPAEGGLYMLVAQGVRASEIFTDKKYPDEEIERAFCEAASEKENIVLIGMPGSGKSTVARLIANVAGRELIDTDELIASDAKMSIPKIFEKLGEPTFRDLESAAIMRAAEKTSAVIATGGGAPLREKNLAALRQNGKVYFLDRPLSALLPTEDRPLAKSAEDIKKLYKERYEIYRAAADVIINADASAEAVMMEILK